VIRLFRVYYPVRTLGLLVGEALIVWLSFFFGMLLTLVLQSPDGWLKLNNALVIEGGYAKILGMTVVVLFLSHWLDLYDTRTIEGQWIRLIFVIGLVTIGLLVIRLISPLYFGANGSLLIGIVILIFALFLWRIAYSWLIQQPYLRERVYVLGTGDRAQRLLAGLHERSNMGITVVGWTGDVEGELTREVVAAHLLSSVREGKVHRVIVAMPDRRKTLPVRELLNLRLEGVKVEEATSWLERINGHIELDQLNPSWLVFADGFRFSTFSRVLRRCLNFTVALIGLVLSIPLLPFVYAAVKLGSPGPALYRQKRVGRGGTDFYCYKFRTMRQDAEADTGATWAADNDPRITRVGKFLRASRLDEIPQLYCVLKGDMHFVGPRPERPEFVEWLNQEIPFYWVRHTVRPGITGWAQVQYKYGNTLADAREKLQYDLFYIKNKSVGLDLWIMFQTVKIVLLGRQAAAFLEHPQ